MGGETAPRIARLPPPEGPSPRGRGNQYHVHLAQVKLRSIPAWAGKPAPIGKARSSRGVHPRVGGETPMAGHQLRYIKGPSPRGRGNPPGPPSRRVWSRSIPAWAGKPSAAGAGMSMPWVHPRVGGETGRSYGYAATSVGPSPRGRGNPSPSPWLEDTYGSIPAWAGKPRWIGRRISLGRVHPRVGGETTPVRPLMMKPMGPSPRGRGNQINEWIQANPERSIPAWAGKPPKASRRFGIARVHPRVGGETR